MPHRCSRSPGLLILVVLCLGFLSAIPAAAASSTEVAGSLAAAGDSCRIGLSGTGVTITSPRRGEVVSGSVRVAGVAASLTGLLGIYVAVDSQSPVKVELEGELLKTFEVELPIEGLAEGVHVVSVEACDTRERGSRDTREVSVEDAGSAPTTGSDVGETPVDVPPLAGLVVPAVDARGGSARMVARAGRAASNESAAGGAQALARVSTRASRSVAAGDTDVQAGRGASAAAATGIGRPALLALALLLCFAVAYARRRLPVAVGASRGLALIQGPAAVQVGTAVAVHPARRRARRSVTPAPEESELVSVLIMTHNDGPNITALVARALEEPRTGEVVVVASECTDDTVDSVLALASSDERVRLFVEPVRSGKAPAFNFALRQARFASLVLISGDVMPAPGAIGLVLRAIETPGVGMAGGRPIPLNPETSFMGFGVHLLWRLHHRLALVQPKLGEMIAMRAEAAQQLPLTSVDEACLQALVQANGWECAYVPEAVVSNWAPTSVTDFIKQRRRIHCGHLWLRGRHGYTVPSLRPFRLVRELAADSLEKKSRLLPRGLVFTTGTVLMEMWARGLARYDYWRGREHHAWEMVKSAKAGGSDQDGGDAGCVDGIQEVGQAPTSPGQPDGQRHISL